MKMTLLVTVSFASAVATASACDDSLIISGGGNGASGGDATDDGVGGAATSGSGGVPDVPPYVDAENIQPWSGNGSSCPAQVPNDLTACTGEGDTCAYWFDGTYEPSYQECACFEASGGVLKFHCYVSTNRDASCPVDPVEAETPCGGHVGTSCPFPGNARCWCDAGDDPLWQCEQPPPPFANLPAPPVDVESTKAISSLTPAERTSWCNWHESTRLPPGQPPVPEWPLTADGYVIDGGCQFGNDFFDNATKVRIPVSYCVGNLSLSTCAAPVSELTDCVLTMAAEGFGGWPYEHGCARYLDKPGCIGTILSPPHDQSGQGGAGVSDGACHLKVQ